MDSLGLLDSLELSDHFSDPKVVVETVCAMYDDHNLNSQLSSHYVDVLKDYETAVTPKSQVNYQITYASQGATNNTSLCDGREGSRAEQTPERSIPNKRSAVERGSLDSLSSTISQTNDWSDKIEADDMESLFEQFEDHETRNVLSTSVPYNKDLTITTALKSRPLNAQPLIRVMPSNYHKQPVSLLTSSRTNSLISMLSSPSNATRKSTPLCTSSRGTTDCMKPVIIASQSQMTFKPTKVVVTEKRRPDGMPVRSFIIVSSPQLSPKQTPPVSTMASQTTNYPVSFTGQYRSSLYSNGTNVPASTQLSYALSSAAPTVMDKNGGNNTMRPVGVTGEQGSTLSGAKPLLSLHRGSFEEQPVRVNKIPGYMPYATTLATGTAPSGNRTDEVTSQVEGLSDTTADSPIKKVVSDDETINKIPSYCGNLVGPKSQSQPHTRKDKSPRRCSHYRKHRRRKHRRKRRESSSSSCTSSSTSGSASNSRSRSRSPGESKKGRSGSPSSDSENSSKQSKSSSRSMSVHRSKCRHRSRSRHRSKRRTCKRKTAKLGSKNAQSKSASLDSSSGEREKKRRTRSPTRSKLVQKKQQDHEKAMSERRVVYIGGIPYTYTPADLRKLFDMYGSIHTTSVHFREHGDNYGFVTFCNTQDAFKAVEGGKQRFGAKFTICFGGRRKFCKTDYADLDGCTAVKEKLAGLDNRKQKRSDDFDRLLKQTLKKIKP